MILIYVCIVLYIDFFCVSYTPCSILALQFIESLLVFSNLNCLWFVMVGARTRCPSNGGYNEDKETFPFRLQVFYGQT